MNSVTNTIQVAFNASVGGHVTGDNLVVTVQLQQQNGYGYGNMQYYSFPIHSIISDISNEMIMSEVRRRGLLNLMKDYKSKE
jgi:hypothetical protein